MLNRLTREAYRSKLIGLLREKCATWGCTKEGTILIRCATRVCLRCYRESRNAV